MDNAVATTMTEVAALQRVVPLAIKTDADVLREAGWTTQIPALPEVAAPASGPL